MAFPLLPNDLLYINRIQTDENILVLSTESGKTEKLILNLTPYKDTFWTEEESLLENGEIYSITFQTSIVDINAGWVPFDRFDFYIPIKDEEKQQGFLDKFTKKENHGWTKINPEVSASGFL